LYNACLRVALDRAQAMRAGARWEVATAMPRTVVGTPNPERTSAFRALRERHGFTGRALASVASGFRVGWLREQVFAQEAQVLGARAYDAVNRWVLGQRGRPRFKPGSTEGSANSTVSPQVSKPFEAGWRFT